MKKFLFSVCAALCLATASAQDFRVGDNVLDFNVGFGGHAYDTSLKMGSGWLGAAIPVQVSYEIGIVDGLCKGNASIGVGANFSYGTRGEKSSYEYLGTKYKTTFREHCIDFAVKGNFHYQFVDALDTYVGLQVGVGGCKAKVKSGNSKSTGGNANAVVGAYLGARYYVNESFAVLGEIGGGIHSSIFKVGAALRF